MYDVRERLADYPAINIKCTQYVGSDITQTLNSVS